MAGKRRNKADKELPLRVYRGRSAYEWKAPFGKTFRLCSLSAPLEVVWREYKLIACSQAGKSSFGELIHTFMRSSDFRELAFETQKDYSRYATKVIPVFGKMGVNNIEPRHIRIYMDKRGQSSRIQANREHCFMSRCFRYGYERGLCKGNPCRGVRKFKEVPRSRYITDDEYDCIYEVARPLIRVAMELAYLCCARQADILSLRTDHLTHEGIYIAQSKTGVKQIKLWSPRLLDAIDLSLTLPKPNIVSDFVICNKQGYRISRQAFNNQWQATKQRARALFKQPFDFTFHDLKAKGISDIQGTLQEKQEISGHLNASQTARYDRKVKQVRTVDQTKTASPKTSSEKSSETRVSNFESFARKRIK